jgi:hypothetical protein
MMAASNDLAGVAVQGVAILLWSAAPDAPQRLATPFFR